MDETPLNDHEDALVDSAGDETQPTAEILAALNSPVKSEPQPEAPPPSEYDALTAKLVENPHNPEGWKRLVDLAEASGEITKVKRTYDELLKHYPNTSSAQIAYITHYLNDEETFGEAEHLFIKFLRTSPSVDLWKFYLTYVRRRNVGPSASTRDTVRKSYEFALNHVGQDKDSGEIWSDYIQFLKAGETSSTWEEQQKMDALRKVYHRAVQIPLDNVERLWSELETFETNLNKITAKKFMADLSPAHMQARTTLRQLANHLNALYPSPLSLIGPGPNIFLPSLPKFDASERSLVGKWKAYLKWEESNPLEIEEKDRTTLVTRIQGVYRKAVIRMRYYSEIWFMAYTWTNSVGKHEEALAILKAGMEANPSSFLLTFTYVESLELKKDYAEVHATYEKFLGILSKNLDALEKSISDSAPDPAPPPQVVTNDVTSALPPGLGNGSLADIGLGTQSNNSSFNTQASDEKPSQSSELQERKTEYGLAYIMHMRFARRAEGLASLRKVFGKARRDPSAPWEVYEAGALMEYHCFDDKSVASRIFEKGMENFGGEIDYVLRYLGFLISINDGSNARALFERVIPTFPAERARPLWERWARYEYQYGDLEGALKLEKRIAEVYPNDPPIKRFAQRHIYLGTDAIAARDLGFAMARRATTSSSSSSGSNLGRTETAQSLFSSGTPISSSKRPASPDFRNKRDESRGGGDYSSGHKRPRGPSPLRGDRDRDRDRWDGAASSRRRFTPPSSSFWDRDREKDEKGRPPLPPPRDRDGQQSGPSRAAGTGITSGPSLPPIISWFIGELPPPATFDGPIFKTDDLLEVFRKAVIPRTNDGTNGQRARSPPPATSAPPRGGGRPPPDYGPYQGPGGGRTGRKY